MKRFYPLAIFGIMGLSACKEDVYVLDAYSTMRYDVLHLPATADTLALNTVDFVSATTGFVGGAGGSLFATTDAGATWTRRSQPTLGIINKLLFTTATSGWAGTSTGLYRTSNAGQTWQYVATNDVYGYSMAVQDVQFVTPLVGYAVGTGGGINKTTNGGTSWATVQRRTDKRYTFRAVSFTSPDSGMIVGNQQARWLTSNGGQTWDFTDSYAGRNDDYYGYAILRFNVNTYMVGTPSGFRSYSPQTMGSYDHDDENYGYPVYGLATAGPKGPVVAVGERTIIRQHAAYSLQESTPWVYVHAPNGTTYADTYYAADFADANTFYAVGPQGLIHRFHYQ